MHKPLGTTFRLRSAGSWSLTVYVISIFNFLVFFIGFVFRTEMHSNKILHLVNILGSSLEYSLILMGVVVVVENMGEGPCTNFFILVFSDQFPNYISIFTL